ncbi:MAG TPA: PmoA family protein [Vicinamibacterales bacterium]|nr:PmoA family protein [Vicinamibacterales bacterium]
MTERIPRLLLALLALRAFINPWGPTGSSTLQLDPESVELTREGSHVDVRIGGRPFTTYYVDPSVAKPYFFPFRSAAGTIVTRSFPMVADVAGEHHDEPHQRAMYFAHGDINGFDFWGEAAFPKWSDHPVSTFGRTVFRTVDEVQSGSGEGRLRATFDLVAPTGTIGEETQDFRFTGDQQSRIIDCEFVIRASHGPITMGDTKEGTFAIRLVRALESPPGRIVNADDATGEKGVWGKRSNWVDYSGRVANEDVGVAIFDHPQNLRAPTYWHARGYGLVAANPFGVRQFTGDRRQDGKYVIPAGGSLVLRYQVFIHHGSPTEAGVAAVYRQFARDGIGDLALNR